MIYPEVEYPSEPVAPTPPANLAETLLALEHPDADIRVPENHEDVLMVEAGANPPAMDNSFATSSAGPSVSVMMNTMEKLQKNQESLATRLDKTEDTHAGFRSFMKDQKEATQKQVEDTVE